MLRSSGYKYYRGHRLVASSNPKNKGKLHCSYCGETVEEESTFTRNTDDDSVLCKRNPAFKKTETQKVWR